MVHIRRQLPVDSRDPPLLRPGSDSPTSNEIQDKNDEGDYEQEVNQSPTHAAEESECPEHQKNEDDRPQHRVTPFHERMHAPHSQFIAWYHPPVSENNKDPLVAHGKRRVATRHPAQPAL